MDRLSKAQRDALRPFVSGKTIHDLGAGMCIEARMLVGLGARHVVAVDKDSMPTLDDPRIEQKRCYFADLADTKAEVAFVCYPINRSMSPLNYLCSQAQFVVYIGKNTDGTACAAPDFFQSSLLSREVLAYVPERRNTMIVYGRYLPPETHRSVRGEERACIEGQERIITFEEAEGIVGAIASLSPD